jgi:hypothetical protein
MHKGLIALLKFGGLIGFSGDDINKFLWWGTCARPRVP